jgi:hypothetical protein
VLGDPHRIVGDGDAGRPEVGRRPGRPDVDGLDDVAADGVDSDDGLAGLARDPHRVLGSSRDREWLPAPATQTASSLAATQPKPSSSPSSVVPVTMPAPGSTRDSVPFSMLIAHSDPAPKASVIGSAATGISRTTRSSLTSSMGRPPDGSGDRPSLVRTVSHGSQADADALGVAFDDVVADALRDADGTTPEAAADAVADGTAEVDAVGAAPVHALRTTAMRRAKARRAGSPFTQSLHSWRDLNARENLVCHRLRRPPSS